MALSFVADESPIDPELARWASPTQLRALEQVAAHGGTIKGAEKALGLANDTLGHPIRRLRKLAESKGYSPEHDMTHTVPDSFQVSRVSTYHKATATRPAAWVQSRPLGMGLDDFVARCDERLAAFKRFDPIPPPPVVTDAAKFTNFLGLFDLHIGEKISCVDPAGRWDIATAKRTIKAAVVAAFLAAPKAKRVVVCFGGDAAHYDGLSPVTPRSKHVLHSDGDFDDMMDAVMDVAIFALDHALANYEEVHCIWAEGNHDEAGSVVMRKMLARLYRHEPRLSVVQSRFPYYALLFGKVMICVHHGHGSKLETLAGKFANIFREMWGKAVYAYAHAGHQHHIHAKEKDGLVATQHSALPPSDDYALSKALISRRACQIVTYHDDYGEHCTHTIRPEQLGVFDEDEALAQAA